MKGTAGLLPRRPNDPGRRQSSRGFVLPFRPHVKPPSIDITAMRTYDKLIATIPARRSMDDARPCSGRRPLSRT